MIIELLMVVALVVTGGVSFHIGGDAERERWCKKNWEKHVDVDACLKTPDWKWERTK